MKLTNVLPIAVCASSGMADPSAEPQNIFSMPEDPLTSIYKIPTPYESAVQGRRILALTPLGTLSTVFPDSSRSVVNYNGDGVSGYENRPSGLAGVPIGLMDYIADCEEEGNPTILAINIATSFKNVAAGSNISLGLQWTPPYPPSKRIRSSPCGIVDRLLGKCQSDDDDHDDEQRKEPVPYSAANLPRFSIIGYLEKVPTTASLASCFVKTHPDAKYWLPGNKIHEAEFVRLVVQQIYWVGGFGDRAYIGWLSPDDWKNITREEWENVRLPGEKKGWKEWTVQYTQEL